ncbi:MAG: hypothetical protein KKH72_10565 [Alphaproteobacteria bacterium]|nr:hypothetical protein [Alphaproteobacteria bacterium]
MSEKDRPLTPWAELGPDARLALQRDYQVEIDRQPLTCSLDEKMARFTAWLETRGIRFTMDDLRRR